MSNKAGLAILGLFLLTSIAGCTNQGQQKAEKPNIIVFLADDLGYGDLACYGNPIIQTPHIDALAGEGVRMTDFHSGGTVCSPSRAALLTGRNPYRSGFYYILGRDAFLKDDEVTIAEILQQDGYETCFLGKWHLSLLEKQKIVQPDPGDQGFHYWMGTTHNAFDGPANTKKFIRNGEPLGEVDGWYCDVIVDEAVSWLNDVRDKSKPFFLYICSHEPHTPIGPPLEYSTPYDTDEVDALEEQMKYGGVSRPERDIEDNKKYYYGTVTQLDDAFGRLMKEVENQNLNKNTLVLFTSDNGPETPVTLEESLGEWEDPIRDNCFGTPGLFRGMKRYPYEGGHRVPGIVRFPGVIPAGSVSSKLFNGTDILPTICEITNNPLPEILPLDGEKNMAALLDQDKERKNPAIWFYPNHGDTYFRMPQASMRHKNFNLVGWLPQKPDSMSLNEWFFHCVPSKFELYDIIMDPGQRKNIAEQHPEVVEELAPKMTKLWVEMRDEGRRER